MRKGLLAFAILVSILMVVMPAAAQDAASQSSADAETSLAAGFPTPVRISGVLMGNGKFTSGGCTQGFSNQCPSGHACICFTMNAGKFFASKIGRGAANFLATIDQTASFGPVGNKCMPMYGLIEVIAKKDSPNFDVWGAACTDPSSNFVANGAMGLASSSLFTVSGYSTFTSTLITNSGHLVLKFSGAAQ